MPPQSVHDWLKKGQVVGWRVTKRGYVFPAEQFDDRSRPMQRLNHVVGCFGDGYAAWVWLSTTLASLDGTSPLTLLENGDLDCVEAAAEADRQGDFA